MTELELKNFVKTVTDYFLGVTGIPAEMGLPFIKDERIESYDYTGLIGISGIRRGGVYYTATADLLREFAGYILGEIPEDENSLIDLVGEMTNTIAGNMRELFGSSFLISVPMVVSGRSQDIALKLRPPVFIIPIRWKGKPSHLAIGLE